MAAQPAAPHAGGLLPQQVVEHLEACRPSQTWAMGSQQRVEGLGAALSSPYSSAWGRAEARQSRVPSEGGRPGVSRTRFPDGLTSSSDLAAPHSGARAELPQWVPSCRAV